MNITITVLLDVTCSLVDSYQRFEKIYCLHLQTISYTLKKEEADFVETVECKNPVTRYHISEYTILMASQFGTKIKCCAASASMYDPL